MIKRTCPSCKNRSVLVAELYDGSRCLSCHKTVEVNVIYSWGLSLILVAIAGVSFHYGLGAVGLCATAIIVVYSSGYKKIISHYFPLKVYLGARENA